MTREGQVWLSVYHDEVFLILRSWQSYYDKDWIMHEVLTLSSAKPKKRIHNFSEQHVGYWEESPVMDRLL
jgi:hypothetical protein